MFVLTLCITLCTIKKNIFLNQLLKCSVSIQILFIDPLKFIFVDSPWKTEEWMGVGVRGRWEEQEEGREWKLGLICKKKKKDCPKKQ